jgi:hypothetical protein
MKPEKPGQIEGYFLSFSPGELAEINTMLDEEGYTQDIEGLKKFILDCTAEEPVPGSAGATDRVINGVERFIKENPATVQAALSIGKSVLFKRKP